VSIIDKLRGKLSSSLSSSFSSARLTAAAALVGAGFFGLAEALRVNLGATYLDEGAVTGVLMLSGLLTVLPLGLAVGLLVGLPLGSQPRGRRVLAGFSAGLLAVVCWDLAVVWYTDPPPFTEGMWQQGNHVIAGLVLGLLAAIWGLAVWRLRGARATSAAVAVLSLVVGIWVATAVPMKDPPGEARSDAPNLLWVTIDTVRADHMSTYGGRAETPAFQRVADGGVLFEQAFAQIAVTGPSHTTMLTGTGPWTHGTLLNGIPVREDLPLLPEILREHGYRSAAFVSAYVLDGDLGYARGFDVYDDELGRFPGLGDLVFFRSVAMLRRHFRPDLEVERRGDATTDKALTWLAGRDAPWFLWVHLFDPHGPYEPPAPFDERYAQGVPATVQGGTPVVEQYDVAPYLRASLDGVTSVPWVVTQYDGEISYADQQLGRILDALETSGSLDRTLVVVNGDHGESLGEHEVWFDHGDDLYDPATWVPLAIRLPGGGHAGVQVDDPVELVDLAPTILDLLGLPRAESMEGRTLRDTMQGTGHRIQARGLCFDRPANQAARQAGTIEQPTWRLASLRAPMSLFVRRESPDHPDEYYDMAEDPSQSLSELEARLQDPDGAQLMGMLAEQADRLMQGMGDELVERSTQELSSEAEEALRALGYID
jgi:choline-sulfatase